MPLTDLEIVDALTSSERSLDDLVGAIEGVQSVEQALKKIREEIQKEVAEQKDLKQLPDVAVSDQYRAGDQRSVLLLVIQNIFAEANAETQSPKLPPLINEDTMMAERGRINSTGDIVEDLNRKSHSKYRKI